MIVVQGTLVSRFKPANQASTLSYGFEWTAEKAVDGDYRSSNPNNDASCATTDQANDNFWRVDLLQQYDVDRIEIYSRSDGISSVLSPLLLYYLSVCVKLSILHIQPAFFYV